MTPPIQPRAPFVLRRTDDGLHLRFLSSRVSALVLILIFLAVGLGPATLLSLTRTRGEILSMVWGGTLSFVLTGLFVLVPRLSRQEIRFEDDLVRIQRTYFRVPVGAPRFYARNLLTDLGAYYRMFRDAVAPLCVLSTWHDGKSIELEHLYRSDSVRRLRWELAQQGVTFPSTMGEPESTTPEED